MRNHVSVLLILLPLLAILHPVPFLVTFKQDRTPREGFVLLYENFVHESGLSRIVIFLISTMVLIFPFREKRRWAFVALLVVFSFYWLPIYVFPSWVTFHGLWIESLVQSEALRIHWLRHLLTLFFVSGLALSADMLVRKA